MNHIRRSLNTAVVIGTMNADPVVAEYPGIAILRTKLLTTSVFKTDEDRAEREVFVPVEIINTCAWFVFRNTHKGSRLLVTGSIKIGDDGLCIDAEHVQILSPYKDQPEVTR